MQEIENCQKVAQSGSWKNNIKHRFLHHNNAHSTLHWPSLLVLLLAATLLLLAYAVQTNKNNWLVLDALLLLALMIINLYLLAWDNKLRLEEPITMAKSALMEIEKCARTLSWSSANFISLHAPLSPCVSLQWTVRDGEIVNMPWSLLVEGDVILLRPGQAAPSKCRLWQYEGEEDIILEYGAGDIYNPDLEADAGVLTNPKARDPLKPAPFILLETPFVHKIRSFLMKSHDRPVSVINNERFCLYNIWVERRMLPILLLFSLLANTLRYIFLSDYVGHWSDVFIVLQIQTVLPLTILVFPVIWKLIDIYGLTKLSGALKKSSVIKEKAEPGDVFDEMDQDTHLANDLNRDKMLHEFCNILLGHTDMLPRTANIVHCLGNVTSLCCVDKKGVLSLPNPTAEKVFFLRDHKSHGTSVPQDSQDMYPADQRSTNSELGVDDNLSRLSSKDKKVDTGPHVCNSFEVLDLSKNTEDGCSLEFDDPNWRKYIDSLKPLGLNILLNTCNMETAEKYTEFADHVTCASYKWKIAVPVVNRRCFCELSRKMGFSEQALKLFQLENVLGMYRHMQPAVNTEKTTTKSFTKYRMPMANVFSVVEKDENTGMKQMFSQGTADLLLDTCTDYWNGSDLCSLTEVERKCISDFYHRNSMSSYCTAFAYRPITQNIGSEFGSLFIEVPHGGLDLFSIYQSPSTPRTPNTKPPMERKLSVSGAPYYGSADSFITGVSLESAHDVESCFQAQCNEIFIGMITMQYQAKREIVQLIEDLESSCIRFVHFSKENELRSRVFSEKMGLEAGWNCHISLLSENDNESIHASQVNISHCQSLASSVHQYRHSTHMSSDSVLPMHRVSREQLSGSRSAPAANMGRRRCSAPGQINLDMSHVKFAFDVQQTCPLDSLKLARTQSQEDHRINNDGKRHKKCEPHGDVNKTPRKSSDSTVSNPILRHPHRHSHHAVSIKHVTTDINMTFDEDIIEISMKEKEEGSPLQPLLGEQSVDGHDVCKQNTRSNQNITDKHSVSSQTSFQSSCMTDSASGTMGRDSNRANLPKGIEDIRPHIENVDNVPLLVSLFTDCTPSTTGDMLEILQEYGEVVCCLGSSANIQNMGVFLQANCSIGIDPLYPQVCVCHPVVQQMWDDVCLSPMELSARLQTLPCSLTLHESRYGSIMDLVALARHHCQSVRSLFLLLFMLQLSLGLLQLFCSMSLHPPALALHHVFWLAVIASPALCLPLLANPVPTDIVQMAQGKNINNLNKHVLKEFIFYYILRYIPTLILCIVSHGLNLHTFCEKLPHLSNHSCSVGLGDTYPYPGTWNGWATEYNAGLVLSQNVVAMQLVIYFTCSAMCYIHRRAHLRKKPPWTNLAWCIVAPVLVLCQVVYFAVDLALVNSRRKITFGISDIPIATWVITIVWPFILVLTHELVKHREIKSGVRYQKRARLDFGTKLGMNSPF